MKRWPLLSVTPKNARGKEKQRKLQINRLFSEQRRVSGITNDYLLRKRSKVAEKILKNSFWIKSRHMLIEALADPKARRANLSERRNTMLSTVTASKGRSGIERFRKIPNQDNTRRSLACWTVTEFHSKKCQ